MDPGGDLELSALAPAIFFPRPGVVPPIEPDAPFATATRAFLESPDGRNRRRPLNSSIFFRRLAAALENCTFSTQPKASCGCFGGGGELTSKLRSRRGLRRQARACCGRRAARNRWAVGDSTPPIWLRLWANFRSQRPGKRLSGAGGGLAAQSSSARSRRASFHGDPLPVVSLSLWGPLGRRIRGRMTNVDSWTSP